MKTKASSLLTLVLALCLLVSLPVSAWAQTEPTEAPEEQQRVLQIQNETQFLKFAEDCRLDAYSQGLTVRLTQDLDLEGMEFSGIPLFCGTFEGNRHTIRNLTLTASGSNLGLFRYLAPGSLLKDLTVIGTVTPEGSQQNIGGLVGTNRGTVRDCRFSGTLSGENRVGGIAGSNALGGVLENCYTDGSFDAVHFLGGIAGENYGVIRGCSNRASVNTVARENTVNVASISLETIAGSEAANTVTDIGGIAGSNIGVIRSCSNRGTVGYPHIGYNIGGIAGSHLGYLSACQNYGDIHGRKEVGGIAGQFEPASLIAYQEDALQTLEKQLSATSSLLNRASYNAQSHMGAVGESIAYMQEDAGRAGEALRYLLEGHLEDPDSIIAARNELQASMQSMRVSIQDIGSEAGAAAGQLGQDMQAVSSQMGAMGQTIRKAKEAMGIRLSDISDEDTEELTDGKIADCKNYAPVSGDLNTGGIAGAIALENDLDPEDDLQELGTRSLNLDATLRAVILRCENQGEITGKKTNIGGIAGWLTLGLIKDCTNTGKISAEKAQYVGGIAGNSRGYLRSCYVKCGILADKCAGGIAGSATVVTDCRSMVTIRQASEKTGAILGILEEPQAEDLEAPVSGNLYMSLSQDLGAIDGISYRGQAEPLAPHRFQQLEGLPDIMEKTTLIFRDEQGNQQKKITLPMGTLLRQEEIPPVPQKEGFNGQWQDIEFWSGQRIYFDGIFTPVYTPHRITIASAQTRANGRPVLLAEGTFPQLKELPVQQVEAPDIPDRTILEAWQVGPLARDTDLTLHFSQTDHPDAEHLQILVRQKDGSWQQRESTVNARYVIFSLAPEEAVFCVAEVPDYTRTLYVFGGGAGLILLLTVLIVRKTIRKRKAAGQALQSGDEAHETL